MTFILLTWIFSFHEKTSKVIKGVEIMKVYPSVQGMFCYLTMCIMCFSEYVPHAYRYMCMCVCVCGSKRILLTLPQLLYTIFGQGI